MVNFWKSVKMGGGELFLKGASTTFTGYFLLVSVAYIAYGLTSTFYLLKVNSVETLDKDLVAVPSLCLVLFGALLLSFIILGCCAVCREIPCCLETYSIFLAILATAQLGVGVFCLIQFIPENIDLENKIADELSNAFLDYGIDSRQMDDTQHWMRCCGVTSSGPQDWLMGNLTIPASCCENNLKCDIAASDLYQEGCSREVFVYVVGTNFVIGLILIIVGATELLGSMMGISLSCAFWRRSRIMWI